MADRVEQNFTATGFVKSLAHRLARRKSSGQDGHTADMETKSKQVMPTPISGEETPLSGILQPLPDISLGFLLAKYSKVSDATNQREIILERHNRPKTVLRVRNKEVFRFFKLPQELRDMIYELLLPSGTTVILRGQGWPRAKIAIYHCKDRTSMLYGLNINRQMRKEGLGILLESNTVEFDAELWYFRHIGSELLGRIRRIRLLWSWICRQDGDLSRLSFPAVFAKDLRQLKELTLCGFILPIISIFEFMDDPSELRRLNIKRVKAFLQQVESLDSITFESNSFESGAVRVLEVRKGTTSDWVVDLKKAIQTSKRRKD